MTRNRALAILYESRGESARLEYGVKKAALLQRARRSYRHTLMSILSFGRPDGVVACRCSRLPGDASSASCRVAPFFRFGISHKGADILPGFGVPAHGH